jgi:electron transfer flavoprotein alpha/beta subunit
MARKSDVHVVKTKDDAGWDVKRGGRKTSHHRTQDNAIENAIRIAKRYKVDVVTHGRDGKIRSKDSYGNESKVRDREH